jgi:histidinol-phosphatase (PHP family)
MPHSHHSHSGQFCRHAKDDLEDIVAEAIRQGFETYGLSEHAPRYRLEDLFPEEVSVPDFFTLLSQVVDCLKADLEPKDLESTYLAFLAEAQRLRATYAGQINLLTGLETDYITEVDLSKTAALLDSRPDIDYVVGSVHHVNGVSIDFDRPTWIRAVRTAASGQIGTTMVLPPTESSSTTPVLPDVEDVEADPTEDQMVSFLHAYFDAQYDMLQALQPEVIGHFDLCLLWIPRVSLRSKGIWAKVERNVRYVISYGALFEANAAALRKGWSGSYPSGDILEVSVGKHRRIEFLTRIGSVLTIHLSSYSSLMAGYACLTTRTVSIK